VVRLTYNISSKQLIRIAKKSLPTATTIFNFYFTIVQQYLLSAVQQYLLSAVQMSATLRSVTKAFHRSASKPVFLLLYSLYHPFFPQIKL